MKKSILLIISLLLCACAPIEKDTVNKRVTAVLTNSMTGVEIAVANRNKPYYSYYLPTDMGIDEASETGAVFIKNGFNIVFNFNTSNLIINEYYTDLSDEEDKQDVVYKHYTEESFQALIENDLLIPKSADSKKESSEVVEINYDIIKKEKNGICTYRGYYDSAEQTGLPFQLHLKRVASDYYIHLNTTIASFTSIVPAEEVDKVINSMLVVLKSIRYDKEEVLHDFSLKYDLKTMEEKFKEDNDFIYQNLPSEGYLEDLIHNGQ